MKRNCAKCPHNKFGGFGKYGQEHYCDIDDHDITLDIIYDNAYLCPLDDIKEEEK